MDPITLSLNRSKNNKRRRQLTVNSSQFYCCQSISKSSIRGR